ncbi:MAG TPA: hypothetical protein VLW44_06175 [Streptosporangiaceae bacterium]|nr:hypothetical protein [Streptosporangiaceae bacterium]
MNTPQDPRNGTSPFARMVRQGLWALPVWAALLFYGTLTHQPPPQTQLAAWSRYVTTPEFLASHLIASILGAAIGIIGMVALAVFLADHRRPRAAVWGLVTGVLGTTFVTAVFGIAAFAQPAIGRDYLAGHTTAARAMYYAAAQGTWLAVTAFTGAALVAASLVIFGVAVARTRPLPRIAGIGLAVSGPLFAIIGAALDNFIESIACALLIVSTAWIATAARRTDSAAEATSSPAPTPAAAQ